MQVLDDVVVIGVVLVAAASIDHAGHAKPVHFAHEMARGVLLVLGRQLRALGQRGVEDGGVGLGQQQAGRIAGLVADDLAARRIRRVLVVADRAQRGAVEQGAVVEVQDEDGGVGRGGVEFRQRGQALFDELVLGEAAHHAHPLRSRRAGHLVLEHAHGVRQRAHAVPAQFHVVVQAAPDDVHVAVDQPGNGPPAVQVDDLRLRAGQFHDVLARAHADEAAILDGDGIGLGVGAVKRGELAVDQDEVWRGGCHGEELRRSRRTECGSRGNEMPAGN
ncbi:hypothetical protein D3C81_1393140 [compost metagenome]